MSAIFTSPDTEVPLLVVTVVEFIVLLSKTVTLFSLILSSNVCSAEVARSISLFIDWVKEVLTLSIFVSKSSETALIVWNEFSIWLSTLFNLFCIVDVPSAMKSLSALFETYNPFSFLTALVSPRAIFALATIFLLLYLQ